MEQYVMELGESTLLARAFCRSRGWQREAMDLRKRKVHIGKRHFVSMLLDERSETRCESPAELAFEISEFDYDGGSLHRADTVPSREYALSPVTMVRGITASRGLLGGQWLATNDYDHKDQRRCCQRDVQTAIQYPTHTVFLQWKEYGVECLMLVAETSSRVPVFSAGISARFNILGFMVLESYYAYPFQRPDKGGHIGFNLAPGW